jgi:2-haloacid dehalogenase
MLKGDIPENVAALKALAKTEFELFGLTNWSAETFPYALANYDFFEHFGGKIVVSGEEKLIKPDPKIWQVLIERYNILPEESIFIDDNAKNIEVAKKLGFHTIHCVPNINLLEEIEKITNSAE